MAGGKTDQEGHWEMLAARIGAAGLTMGETGTGWGWAEEQGSLPVGASIGGGTRVRFGAQVSGLGLQNTPGSGALGEICPAGRSW